MYMYIKSYIYIHTYIPTASSTYFFWGINSIVRLFSVITKKAGYSKKKNAIFGGAAVQFTSRPQESLGALSKGDNMDE